ncbi:hypothetical protein FACS1894184_20230 [Clostridia bacterium]|nr:hypothetical protein FACS1894184_20230 [Clostridia bacterium]
MNLNILGKEYTLEESTVENDPELCDADGYCDYAKAKIGIRSKETLRNTNTLALRLL